jgi:hypothetical protein
VWSAIVGLEGKEKCVEHQAQLPLRFLMPHLPPTLWGFITVGGTVSVLLGSLGYIVKKAVDVSADIVKARLLREHRKVSVVIYGPDGTVARRVEADSP